VLHLTSQHFFHLKLGARIGTNNWAELIALWMLLNFARDKGIRLLQVVGDSKLVVDCFKGRAHLNIIALLPWQRRIRELQETFESISIEHVY
jgi:ribonuclease HI